MNFRFSYIIFLHKLIYQEIKNLKISFLKKLIDFFIYKYIFLTHNILWIGTYQSN